MQSFSTFIEVEISHKTIRAYISRTPTLSVELRDFFYQIHIMHALILQQLMFTKYFIITQNISSYTEN